MCVCNAMQCNWDCLNQIEKEEETNRRRKMENECITETMLLLFFIKFHFHLYAAVLVSWPRHCRSCFARIHYLNSYMQWIRFLFTLRAKCTYRILPLIKFLRFFVSLLLNCSLCCTYPLRRHKSCVCIRICRLLALNSASTSKRTDEWTNEQQKIGININIYHFWFYRANYLAHIQRCA